MDEDNITFERIKASLIKLKIPEEQIKIKTAGVNELKNIDLMSRDCPVRFIITVNALKEGWDCPFAYILASLADKSSAVDVEQILGRILRMPHVQEHGEDLLNLSFVLTASSRFLETIQSVVTALNRAGFSDHDYRALAIPTIQATETTTTHQQTALEFVVTNDRNVSETLLATDSDAIEVSAISTDWDLSVVPTGSPVSGSVAFVEKIKVQAVTENKAFEAKAVASESNEIPSDLESKMNKHKLKEIFREEVKAIRLPQFYIHVETGGWFNEEECKQLFEKDELLKGFKLSQADGNISFEDVASEMYRVDLEQMGDQNYAPKPFKVDAVNRQRFNSIILSGSRDSQVRDVTARLTKLVGNMYPITDPEVKLYVQRIVESLSSEQIVDCLERDFAYVRKIKQKIRTLANVHALKTFNDMLYVGKISLQPSFSFSDTIAPSANAPSFPKSLYSTEASLGGFEGRVINDIANLDSIEWWHRNLSKGKGFRINGFMNHYPDFIIKTKIGNLVVLETKGDDRDNTDSEQKLKLGKRWESSAGGVFKYMMVFDNNPIEGAERLSDALKILGQL